MSSDPQATTSLADGPSTKSGKDRSPSTKRSTTGSSKSLRKSQSPSGSSKKGKKKKKSTKGNSSNAGGNTNAGGVGTGVSGTVDDLNFLDQNFSLFGPGGPGLDAAMGAKGGPGANRHHLSNNEVLEEVRMRFDIQSQKERADRYERLYNELNRESQHLKTQYYHLRDSQADILRSLNNDTVNLSKKSDNQEKIIESLHKQIEETEMKYQSQIEDLTSSHELKLQEAQHKVEDLQNSLEHVKTYIKNRESMEQSLKSLEEELVKKDEIHNNELASQARTKVIEINNLKKALLSKIRETRDSLRLKTKYSLSQISQRTLSEQQQFQRELKYCSQESEKLIDNNKRLSQENNTLRQNVSLQRELESELSKRNSVYQRLIKRLNTRLAQAEGRIRSLMEKDKESKKIMEEAMKNATNNVPNDGNTGASSGNIGNSMSQSNNQNESHASFPPSARSDFNGTADNQTNTYLTLKENKELRNALQQCRTDFLKFKRDHLSLMNLQDQATRIIILELYDLKQSLERDFAENGGLEQYFKRLEEEQLKQAVATERIIKLRRVFGAELFGNNNNSNNKDGNNGPNISNLSKQEIEAVIGPGISPNQIHALQNSTGNLNIFATMNPKQRRLFFAFLLDKLTSNGALQRLAPGANIASAVGSNNTHQNNQNHSTVQPRTQSEAKAALILTKMLTTTVTKSTGVQTAPCSEPIPLVIQNNQNQNLSTTVGGGGGAPQNIADWYYTASAPKSSRINSVRGEVREWGSMASSMPKSGRKVHQPSYNMIGQLN